MSQKKHLLTPEGLEKLKAELDGLVNDRRKEIIERIQEAVSHGDLSENADYAQAKEEQSFIEGRVQEIEEIIKNAEIIHASSHRSTATIGSTVVVMVKKAGDDKAAERTYTIVGANEANPSEGKISNESLIGKALLGRKAGESFPVTTPAGEVQYEVKEIR
jgi:transcription elongation factor GreA